MKKKILVIAVIAILLATCVGGTVAFVNESGTARNVITAGNVDIELNILDESGFHAFDLERRHAIMPGTSCMAITSVKNVGDYDCWVRISIDKVIELALGVNGKPDPEVIQLDINETYWKYLDGYYYYEEILEPGESTKPIFYKETYEGAIGNMYNGADVHVNVVAYAVQSVHNGDDVYSAAGWPARDVSEVK